MHPIDIIFAATKPSHAAISLAGNEHVYLAQQHDFHNMILFSALPELMLKDFSTI